MTKPDPKPRTPRNSRPLGPGAACDKLATLRAERLTRRADLLAEFDAAEADKEAAIRDRVHVGDLQLFDHMAKSLATGEEEARDGLDAPDEGDSAALLELQNIIDDVIGWDTFDAEQGGDYARRLRQVARERDAIADAWGECVGEDVPGPLRTRLDILFAHVRDKHPEQSPTSLSQSSEGALNDALSDVPSPAHGVSVVSCGYDAAGNPVASTELPAGAREYEPGPVAKSLGVDRGRR